MPRRPAWRATADETLGRLDGIRARARGGIAVADIRRQSVSMHGSYCTCGLRYPVVAYRYSVLLEVGSLLDAVLASRAGRRMRWEPLGDAIPCSPVRVLKGWHQRRCSAKSPSFGHSVVSSAQERHALTGRPLLTALWIFRAGTRRPTRTDGAVCLDNRVWDSLSAPRRDEPQRPQKTQTQSMPPDTRHVLPQDAHARLSRAITKAWL